MKMHLASKSDIIHDCSVEDWIERWWVWFCSQDISSNPVRTGDYSNQPYNDQVIFLAGTLGGNPVTRNIAVEEEKHILLPVINVIFTEKEEQAEGNDSSAIRLLGLASNFNNAIKSQPTATEDGGQLHLLEIIGQKTFEVDLPADNIWNVAPGRSNAAAAGFWLFSMVPPHSQLSVRTFARLENTSVYKWKSPLSREEEILDLNVVDVTHKFV